MERIQHVHNVFREALYKTMQLIGKRRLGILCGAIVNTLQQPTEPISN
ncbi:hypothetical protein [Streptomyces sp. NPDC048385]